MAQISMMGKIYQSAFEVVIWLGQATKNSDDVMDAIANFDVQVIQSQEFIEGFSQLLRRSWVFRTWTVQEFVLVKYPPKIQCGAKVVRSGQLFAVRTYLDQFIRYSGQVKAEAGWRYTDTVSMTTKDDVILEHPTIRLIDLRSAILDSEGTPKRTSLARTLKYYRTSRVKYIADKVYGTLGLVNEAVHSHIQASSAKSVSDTYTDAMTYMIKFETEKNGIDVIGLYLTFPCSLTLSDPISRLPSWVPDFSRDIELLDMSIKYLWFWPYQTTRNDGRKLQAELQHGRHQITCQELERSMFSVHDNILFVRGFVVDEVAEVVPSGFCQDFIQDSEFVLDDFFALTEETRTIGQDLKPLLDQLGNDKVNTTYGDLCNANSSLFKAMRVRLILQSMSLQMIDQICRKFAASLGCDTPDEEWMTHIWSDLFEGYPELSKLSEKEFKSGFNYLVCSHSPKVPTYYADSENGPTNFLQLLDAGGPAALKIEVPFKQVFNAPKRFFMTKSSGIYGIGPRGVMNGDKIAFLFPPLFIAFVLRPHGDQYRLLGPCFIPPRRRDTFMDMVSASGRRLDDFHIV